MDYRDQSPRRPTVRLRRRLQSATERCLLMTFISIAAAVTFIGTATSQRSYPALNTPPILYVPDRNWRISETEQVGQIIARIRAEDAENDDLVFGLEPHFHSNYADPSDDGGGAARTKLPFRIDPAVGVVYLNESLIGRAGENFFLYITVSDGQLTAKNEVFVNILGSNSNQKLGSRATPSIANVVHNISQFLPSFDQLPGVQSIRHQQANGRPSNNRLPGYNINSFFSPHRPFGNRQDGAESGLGGVPTTDSQISIGSSFSTPQTFVVWPTNPNNGDDRNNAEVADEIVVTHTPDKATQATSTIRTKLIPVSISKDLVPSLSSGVSKGNTFKISGHPTERTYEADDVPATPSPTAHSIQTTTIPLVLAVCGFTAAAVAGFGFFFRQRLCAISKTLKKKSKEEMAKKSNQSNLSSNLTDDSRNSMVLQHWNGPMAFSNRYVPWERDQQMMQQNLATSQLSTSVVNTAGVISANASALGAPAGGTVAAPSLGPGGADGSSAAAPCSSSGDNTRSVNSGDRWEFPRHRLKFFNILGEGAFGQVWRCEATDIDGLEGVTTVAVKTLKENATEVEKNDLVSELQVMKSLQPHVNVVRLLGCCTDKDPLFVIIEYVKRGKLQTFLRNSRAERHYGNTHGKSNILTSGDLTSFMYQVAKGMDYLTSRGIIHRDLAARNVLVTDDHTCKVADFGFARDVITSKIYERKSEGKLPIRWMAIESLYDNIFSVKSDVWSFGILMWEIVTLGSTPYPGISAADVMRKVRDGHRLEKPEHCRRELYNIMYYCWSEDANERPTFAELVQMLDKLLQTEMDYIELERFPDHNYYNILNLSGEKL